MGEVLADASAGALSPLERRYLRDVERRHRLPAGERQARRDLAASGRSAYDDVRYAAYGVVVELDGLATHGRSVDRWADLERDLEVAGAGEVSLRVGWRQVLDPCRLARLVSAVLAARGWTGELTCVSGACSAPGAEDAPLSA